MFEPIETVFDKLSVVHATSRTIDQRQIAEESAANAAARARSGTAAPLAFAVLLLPDSKSPRQSRNWALFGIENPA